MFSGQRRLGMLLFAFTSLWVGCGNDNAKVRIMQASPNESTVDALIDGKSVATNVAYGTASGYISVSSGSRHLQIEPSGSSTVISDESLNFSSGTNSTVILSGLLPTLTTLNLADNRDAPQSGDFQIRLVNVAPAMGAADVYVVAPGTNLLNVSPNVKNLANETASGYLTLAAGTYEIFFTAPNSVSAFIDTGPITFSDGQVRTVVALDAPVGGFTFSTLPDLN
jgi:hypothetical protein